MEGPSDSTASEEGPHHPHTRLARRRPPLALPWRALCHLQLSQDDPLATSHAPCSTRRRQSQACRLPLPRSGFLHVWVRPVLLSWQWFDPQGTLRGLEIFGVGTNGAGVPLASTA